MSVGKCIKAAVKLLIDIIFVTYMIVLLPLLFIALLLSGASDNLK